MKVDVRPRRQNSHRADATKRCPQFLQWLRGRSCLAAMHITPCYGRIEAAHVDYAGDKGIATKVSDKFAVPLCSAHHGVQHDTGWQTFEREFLDGAGSALRASEVYWKAWPGPVAWEAKR